jgi:DNA polymerase III subunit alpha
VLPPDVNHSETYFTPSDGDIRYGLAAVRNVGVGVVQEIIRARSEQGPFESFTDFCRKVDSGVLHKKCLESLILAGAFDSLGYTRGGLIQKGPDGTFAYEKVTTPILSDRRAEAIGQDSLFGGAIAPALEIDETVLRGPELEKTQLLRSEKEMLGQYVTDHPLLAIKDRLAAQTDREIADVAALGDGEVVTVAGIVTGLGRRYTRRGEPFAAFRLEDLTGGVGVIAFPSVFDKVTGLLAPDRIVLVKGRADLRGRELQLVALEIIEPDLVSEPTGPVPVLNGWLSPGTNGAGGGDPLVVDLPASACTDGLIARLKGLLGMYPGDLPVFIRLMGNDEVTRLRLGEEFCVDGSPPLLSELRGLLGDDAVRLTVDAEALG